MLLSVLYLSVLEARLVLSYLLSWFCQELALQNQKSAIFNTRQECNRQKQIEIQKLIDEYTDQINQLEQK